MNFFEAVEFCFRNYFNFKGRAARREFWYWGLFSLLGTFAAGFVDLNQLHVLAQSDSDGMTVFPCIDVFTLATIVPTYAVGARRFHDMDRSGWWQLITLIPGLGAIVYLIWCAMKGTQGLNRFGPDPLEKTPEIS